MYGVVTRNEEELSWSEFDIAFFEMKDVTGRATEPVADAVNMLSCFGDNAAVEGNEAIAARTADCEVATRDRPYFDWDYVCPTYQPYRDGLLEMVDEAVEASPDLRLDDVGFPRPEYCQCERCREAFAASPYDDRFEWRASVVTDWIETVRDHVPGRLYVTVYPNPYPGLLYRRTGVDLDALADVVDEVVVPLYDTAYGTTYWLEIIAQGFQELLEVPFSLELYAVQVDVDDLIRAVNVASAYGESVLFGYDASNARAAIRRMQADSRDGRSHGPE